MAISKKKTNDAVQIMDNRYGGTPEWDLMVAEEEIKARIGQIIYALRTEAGYSQTRLAEMVKVTQAMISKTENGDYDGDYFGILLKVCYVLNKKVDIGGPGFPITDNPDCRATVI